MKSIQFIGFGLAAATVASGCASLQGTPPQAPEAYIAAPDAGGAPDAAAAPATAAWLTSFATPEIDQLVGEALRANPGLIAAQARADAARFRARASLGRWFPDLDLGLNADRTERPDAAGGRFDVDQLTARATASWEADLWGRVSDQVRASGSDARAAQADLDGARLSVAGQTAQAWSDLAQASLLMDLAREDLQTRRRALEITERRYAQGLSDSLALRTARSQTASAEAALAQQEDSLRVASRRLESLLGRYPGATLLAGSPLPSLPAIADPGAPSDLLSRRPDVAASEARLAAAGLRVSAARKALLPRLTLTASASGAESQLADAIDPDRMVTQLVAGLVAPVFQGGALRAEARAASADARGAAANYVETTLTAWREVEAALSADASLAVRETELARAAVEAREAQSLAERQYANGVATIFELIDAYSRRIDAERGLINARAQRVSNRIAYHVALGGGAETGGLPSAAQAEGQGS